MWERIRGNEEGGSAVNIFIYVIDALRQDHLGCFGYDRPTSPNIDLFSKDCVKFSQAFTTSTYTLPASGSLLTGAYSLTHKARHFDHKFNSPIQRLPEYLNQKGFSTVGISAIGQVSTDRGHGRGFDLFYDLYKQLGDKEQDTLPSSVDINRVLIPWLDKKYNSECFILIWSADPHLPYQIPPGISSQFTEPEYSGPVDGSLSSVYDKASTEEDLQAISNLYDAEIRLNDKSFGEFIDCLKDLQIYDDSLIVLTADHGESLGDHYCKNFLTKRRHFGHDTLPYDELLKIPLLIKFPNSNYIGNYDVLVEIIDIAPTVLDYINCNHRMAGCSLMPVIEGDQGGVREFVHSETQTQPSSAHYFSIRGKEWKYMLRKPPTINYEKLRKPRDFAVEYLMSWGHLSLR